MLTWSCTDMMCWCCINIYSTPDRWDVSNLKNVSGLDARKAGAERRAAVRRLIRYLSKLQIFFVIIIYCMQNTSKYLDLLPKKLSKIRK